MIFLMLQLNRLILKTAVLFSGVKTREQSNPFPYRGTISVYSFLSPLAPTIINAPSSPAISELSPAQSFSPPPARSWHVMASWEDTIIPLLADAVLSSPLLCCSGVGAGALIPLLPAPTLPPTLTPAPPRLLGGGPQRKAWAGL